ncbi:VOC family protein [Neisseria dentiae]|nr:VOC family protein [Neisseria dentiae]
MHVSRCFYRDVFGWEPNESSNEHIAFYQTGSALLFALFGKHALAEDAGVSAEGSGFARFTLAHNVSSEAEVDELFRTFSKKNVTVVKQPQTVFFWGGIAAILPIRTAFYGKSVTTRF